MWKIEYSINYKLYLSDKIDLKIKILYKNDKDVDVYLNYKGYNIFECMVIWGFGIDLEEWNIKYDVHDNKKPSEIYYSVKREDERAFVDLIYFFISETDGDAMISEEYKIIK